MASRDRNKERPGETFCWNLLAAISFAFAIVLIAGHVKGWW